MKDYYYILGVKSNATSSAIRDAYRKLSLRFHPDVTGGDKFLEERFKDICEAYENLSDDDKRKVYHAQLLRFNQSKSGNSNTDFEAQKREEEFERKKRAFEEERANFEKDKREQTFKNNQAEEAERQRRVFEEEKLRFKKESQEREEREKQNQQNNNSNSQAYNFSKTEQSSPISKSNNNLGFGGLIILGVISFIVIFISFFNSKTPNQNQTSYNKTQVELSKTSIVEQNSVVSGTNCNLHCIFFDYDKSDLNAESKAELDHLSSLLVESKDWIAVLKGYTDGNGDAAYSDAISKSRVVSARVYLTNVKGITSLQIREEYYGKNFPIAKNTLDDSGRKFNRRVELFLQDASGKNICQSVKPQISEVLMVVAPVMEATKIEVQKVAEHNKKILKLPNGDIEVEAGTFLDKLYDELTENTLNPTKGYVFDNLNFASGSAAIAEDSKSQLNDLAKIMFAFPKVSISIYEHTDNVGDATVNLKLSEERAAAVEKYLISKGVADARILPKGFGSNKPVGDNSTEKGRLANRRTEVWVTKK